MREWHCFPFFFAYPFNDSCLLTPASVSRQFSVFQIGVWRWVGAQPCLTLRDPMDCILPGSSVHGILQAQEYWSELPFPIPGGLSDPGI